MLQKRKHVTEFQWLAFILAIITLYRMVVLLQPHMGIFYDGAYYYHWSQTLDFGYYSKPPMVAWLIWISTSLFGVSDFTAKLPATLLYPTTALMIFWVAKHVTSKPWVPFIASLIFITSPLAGFYSLFITTDAPLYFFWAVSLLMFIKAEKSDYWLHWIALGVSLGLGMLSKYTFAALPIGLICYVLASRQWRLLASIKSWSAVIIGLLIFSSNLYWNWQHDFISFNHTRDIANLDGPLINPKALLEFLATQVFVLGFLWVIAIVLKRKTVKSTFLSSNQFWLLAWVLTPILLVISLQALVSHAFGNWAGPFVISASVIAAAAIVQLNRKFLYAGVAIHLVLLSTFYHYPLILDALNTPQTKKNSPYYRILGWQQLAERTNQLISDSSSGNTYLLSPNRDLLAYIGFYSNTHVNNLVFWNPDRSFPLNHYDLKNNLADRPHSRDETYYLITKDDFPSEILFYFNDVEFISKVGIKISENNYRETSIFRVSQFKGY